MLFVLLGVFLAILVLIAWPLTEVTWNLRQRNWIDVVGGVAVFGLLLLNLLTGWGWTIYAMAVVLAAYPVAKRVTKGRR